MMAHGTKLDCVAAAHACNARRPTCAPLTDSLSAGELLIPDHALPYAAPELVAAAAAGRAVVPNPAHDVWALGAIIYEALGGAAPFAAGDAGARAAVAAATGGGRYPWEGARHQLLPSSASTRVHSRVTVYTTHTRLQASCICMCHSCTLPPGACAC
jgi:serine/threonine protein kinase